MPLWRRAILEQVGRVGTRPTIPPLGLLIKVMTRGIFFFKYLWNSVIIPLTVMNVLEGQMSVKRLLFSCR